jgi:redox-sensing transcriptional repressor
MIDRLSRLGVKAALYLASRPVRVPDNMVVVSQDISIELGMLTYRLNEQNGN